MSRGDRSRPERERSHEERERDREERARRREQREGGGDSQAPLPAALPPDAGEPAFPDAAASEPSVEPAFPDAAASEPSAEPAFRDAAASEPSDEPAFPDSTLPSSNTEPELAPKAAGPPLPGAGNEPPAEAIPAAPLQPEVPPPFVQDPHAEAPVQEDPHAEVPVQEDPHAEPPIQQDPHAEPPIQQGPHDEAPVPEDLHDGEVAGAEQTPVARTLAPAALGRAPRPRPHRRGRPVGPARVAALIALLAAIAAVVLVVRALVHSGHTAKVAPPKVVTVLIPEGKTRAQIAEIAKAAGLAGSYRVASRRSPLLNPVHYGAPQKTPDLEGFLFPATYDTNPGEPVARLVQEQLIAFRENFGSSESARARALHVTPYGLLTVASMIEREAQVPGDRAKIAAVIYNRLKQGMPLGIDAAIYYAVEQRKGIATYTSELTESDLHINSPYNTRTHTGLPPTPISNPGLASIKAAAHPARVSYLYYVAAADGCGEQVFSTTQAAFEANAAAYAAAVKRNGGHPPACKHK